MPWRNLCLEDFPLEIYKNGSDLFEENIYQAIDLYTSVSKRDSLGGPSEKEVLRQIAYVDEKLER